jgi:hypothetical protein
MSTVNTSFPLKDTSDIRKFLKQHPGIESMIGKEFWVKQMCAEDIDIRAICESACLI